MQANATTAMTSIAPINDPLPVATAGVATAPRTRITTRFTRPALVPSLASASRTTLPRSPNATYWNDGSYAQASTVTINPAIPRQANVPINGSITKPSIEKASPVSTPKMIPARTRKDQTMRST